MNAPIEARPPQVIQIVVGTICGLSVIMAVTIAGLAICEATGREISRETWQVVAQFASGVFGAVSTILVSTRTQATGGQT